MEMHLFGPDEHILDAASVSEPPRTWWRAPDVAAVVLRVTDPANRAALSDLLKRVTPLARGLARSIGRREVDAMAAHVLRRRSGSHNETIATDLLATALLLEGVRGDAAAQVLVDHLRRQRGLAALPWFGMMPRDGAYRHHSPAAAPISERPRP